MRLHAKPALVVALAASAMLVTACGSTPTATPSSTTPAPAAPSTTATSSSPAAPAPVKLTLWHNATGDKGPAFWVAATAAYTKLHPEVTFDIQIVQNEDFDGKLQTAMAGNTMPDLYLQRGGGKMQEQVDAKMVADITAGIDPTVKSQIGGGFAIESIGDKIYAMPMSIQPEGFWYNSDLFTKAGVDAAKIKTMADLNDAVTKLKGSGVAAISLGAQDAWPAAHWFYQMALRSCTQAEVLKLGTSGLTDPCWLNALKALDDFNKTKPFNNGFLTTVAQQGAGSSAGLVANGKAAMELMGAWQPGVIGGLTPDKQNLASLRFFTFPTIDGGQGGAGALMAGSDGYSCSAKAPQPACTDFLNFLGTQAQQEAYATAFTTLPANPKASGVVSDPALKQAAEALGNSPYTLLWFDSALGQDQGNNLNKAVVALLAGKVDPAGALAQMQAALKG